ncbi:MAG: acyl-CoA thioesterase [Lachnospiraceae bacterium]|nr:acyl-CoA thioesterase [Lachnospiraceae bacterium]
MKSYVRQVNYYETDKMKLTHHSNYVRYMEEARLDFFKQLGFPYDRIESEGIVSPVVSISCEYIRSTTYPDVLEFTVKVKDITAARLILTYEAVVKGTIVFRAESVHCFINENGRPINFKKRYPEFHESLFNQKEQQNKASTAN